MMEEKQINGMKLPTMLAQAIADGTWLTPDKHWKNVFPTDVVVYPELYNFNFMCKVNDTWLKESRPEFLGVADDRAIPGELIPNRSLLIGELQGDDLIALDYQNSTDNPSVVYLNPEGRWEIVANDFDQFWCKLLGVV